MEVKIKKLTPQARLPEYGRPGDAGADLFACDAVVLSARSRGKVPTGIAMELPEGYAALVWDRGGMAAKHGIHTMAGVIDSNYRGELTAILYNTTDDDYTIQAGDKIAQMVIQEHAVPEFIEADSLSDTERGDQAWLSSGK